jgi:hypothetical protein
MQGGMGELPNGYKEPRTDKVQGARQRAGQGQEDPQAVSATNRGLAVPTRVNGVVYSLARPGGGKHRGEDRRGEGPR